MARPKQGDGPTADERIERAFFEVLDQTPFDKLTVSAIVKAAGVNRNSFYYHYADLDDLAQSAVSNVLVPEVPRLIANGFGLESEQVNQAFQEAVGDDRLNRVPLIMGVNSSPVLRQMLKDAFIELWFDVFGLAREDLRPEEFLTVHYVLGGMLEVIGQLQGTEFVEYLRMIRSLEVVQTSARIVMATLGAAAERAAEPPKS